MPFSVTVKFFAVSPLIDFPCLSFTFTASITSFELTDSVYAPFPAPGCVFCPTTCAPAPSVPASIIEIKTCHRILQNLKRSEVCKLRIAFAAAGNPNCVLLMFVIQLV